MSNLFQIGDFRLSGGERSFFKIDCDALTDDDWETLATLAVRLLPSFRAVEGVPRGGLKFAEILMTAQTDKADEPLLIVDDVLTTGGSMERQRAGRDAVGCVVFARGECPAWVKPLFQFRGR